VPRSENPSITPRSRSAASSMVALMVVAGILAISVPVIVALAPLGAARDDALAAESTSRDAVEVRSYDLLLAQYGSATDSALRAVAAGDIESTSVTTSRLIELGQQLTNRGPAIGLIAAERGFDAREFDLAAEELQALADESIPLFQSPGVPTDDLRLRTDDAVGRSRDGLDDLATSLEDAASELSHRAAEGVGASIERGLWVMGISAAVMSAASLAFRRKVVREERRHVSAERERVANEVRTTFEMQLRTGLDMTSRESDAHAVVARGLATIAPELHAELMLADESRTHFEVVAAHSLAGCDGCDVTSPNDCPAIRQGHALVFDDSDALDACPHLRGRAQGPIGGLCIPISIGSRSSGVLHVATPVDHEIDDATEALYETGARVAADRIGMMRAMARSEVQASTDPLTGLRNRRSLDDGAQRLIRDQVPFTVAFGDLDHFKLLNDLHGHETGDRALRLFSRILTMETRPDDIVSRYGGEEFLIVLPQCDAACALDVLGRVRSRLAEEIPRANLPQFTSSFGVAAWDGRSDLQAVIAVADAALLSAKAAGRDRDLVADELEHELADLPTV
jgi:diguanylate cyclase (GGDEF)-like protein